MDETSISIILALGFLTAVLLSSWSKTRTIRSIADSLSEDFVVRMMEAGWLEGRASLSLTCGERKAWLILSGVGQAILELQVAGNPGGEFRVLPRSSRVASLVRPKNAITSDLFVVSVPTSSAVSMVERVLDVDQVSELLDEICSSRTLKHIIIGRFGVSSYCAMPFSRTERKKIVRRNLDLAIRLIEELEDVWLKVDH